MPLDTLRARLRADPTDREGWLVYADRLLDRGDVRGELLALEHRALDARGPEALALRQQIEALVRPHRDAWLDEVPEDESCWLDWSADFLDGLAQPWAEPLRDEIGALRFPSGWLLATLGRPPEGPSPLRLRCDQLVACVLDRIERAFDGVPVPDADHRTLYQAEAADGYGWCDPSRDHRGRWQDLPDSQILDNQWALSHLDEQGIRYYLPAIMAFELRLLLDLQVGLVEGPSWILDSLEYTLAPGSPTLRDYHQRRFCLLDSAQRAAICAFALATRNTEALAAWSRVVEAERSAPVADWFALFCSP